VIPSSLFLLQLLVGPCGDFAPPSVAREEFEPPVSAGLSARVRDGKAAEWPTPELALLMPLVLPKPPNPAAPFDPVFVGLIAPARFDGPIVVLNLFGKRMLA
jgi:hypothetical protein